MLRPTESVSTPSPNSQVEELHECNDLLIVFKTKTIEMLRRIELDLNILREELDSTKALHTPATHVRNFTQQVRLNDIYAQECKDLEFALQQRDAARSEANRVIQRLDAGLALVRSQLIEMEVQTTENDLEAHTTQEQKLLMAIEVGQAEVEANEARIEAKRGEIELQRVEVSRLVERKRKAQDMIETLRCSRTPRV
jgi:hypothetical protein